MQFPFQELYSHIDKKSWEKFVYMFLVKIASKGTSLSEPIYLSLLVFFMFIIIIRSIWFPYFQILPLA